MLIGELVVDTHHRSSHFLELQVFDSDLTSVG